MKKKKTSILQKNKDILIAISAAAVVLAIPLVGMQFSNDWDWSFSDFVIMGILLIGTGLSVVAVSKKVKSVNNRFLIIAALLVAFFFIWAELAVGIFGTPIAGY